MGIIRNQNEYFRTMLQGISKDDTELNRLHNAAFNILLYLFFENNLSKYSQEKL